MIKNKIETKLNSLGRSLQVMDSDVYDKIAARYGDEQPRGGVMFQGPVRFKSNNYITVDTYGRGDIGNIHHQGGVLEFASRYSKRNSAASSNGYWNRPMPFPSNIATLIDSLKGTEQVKLGVDSDPFAWMDRKYRVTLEFLHQLLNSPVKVLCINTRSDLVAMDEYADVLKLLTAKGVNVCVFVHVPTVNNVVLDEMNTQIIEPGVSSIKRRLNAVEKLKSLGIDAHIHGNEVAHSNIIERETGVSKRDWDMMNIGNAEQSSNVVQFRSA